MDSVPLQPVHKQPNAGNVASSLLDPTHSSAPSAAACSLPLGSLTTLPLWACKAVIQISSAHGSSADAGDALQVRPGCSAGTDQTLM